MQKNNTSMNSISKISIIVASSAFLGFLPLQGQELKTPGSVKIGGYVGKRIDDCTRVRVEGQDVEHITDPFKQKNDTASWQTEFWGKWVQGAIASYRNNPTPELYKKIEKSVRDIIATQEPNGYIGNYAPEAHLKEWDVWGRKYTTLGLMAWYRLTGDRQALKAAQGVIDHLMTEVGPQAADINHIGNYHGMAASSVLEPVVYLYNATGEKRYLDFANYIVGQWEKPEGSQLITKALAGVDAAKRFPHPQEWFSPENGQKAYEMMSCYVGLLELYKITGNKAYLDAAERTVQNIVDKEINVAGSGSAFESWYHGRDRQTIPTYHTMETCVTFTWMQICDRLLELTGKPFYADQIEKTIYNALMASLKEDAAQIAKYSPLDGHRFEGEEQCGLKINCCNANGPRGFAMIPEFAFKEQDGKAFLNFYGDMAVNGSLLKLKMKSDYPACDKAEIEIESSTKNPTELNLRIPLWSQATKVKLNGENVEGVTPGSYLALNRKWKKGDRIEMMFDMPVRLDTLNNMQTLTRGPVVFARDSRFNDGFVDETISIDANSDGKVEATVMKNPKNFAWISLEVPATVGSNLETEDAVRKIHFCDFASAGNTWDPAIRYRVWLPRTLNIKLKRTY